MKQTRAKKIKSLSWRITRFRGSGLRNVCIRQDIGNPVSWDLQLSVSLCPCPPSLLTILLTPPSSAATIAPATLNRSLCLCFLLGHSHTSPRGCYSTDSPCPRPEPDPQAFTPGTEPLAARWPYPLWERFGHFPWTTNSTGTLVTIATRLSWQLSFNPWPGEHSNEWGEQPSGAGVTHFPSVVWGGAELPSPCCWRLKEKEKQKQHG